MLSHKYCMGNLTQISQQKSLFLMWNCFLIAKKKQLEVIFCRIVLVMIKNLIVNKINALSLLPIESLGKKR